MQTRAVPYWASVFRTMTLNESTVEDAALEWCGKLGYALGHKPHIAPDAQGATETRTEVVA